MAFSFSKSFLSRWRFSISALTLGCSFKYFYKRVAVDGNYSQRLLNYLKADSNSYYDGSSEASGACEAEAKHVAFKHNAKLKGNNIVSTQVLQKDVYVPDVYEVFICKKYVGMMDNGVFKISNQLIEDARYSPAQLKRKRILSWIAVGIISAIIITVLVFVIIDMNTGK